MNDLFFRATMAYLARQDSATSSSDCPTLAGMIAPLESQEISIFGRLQVPYPGFRTSEWRPLASICRTCLPTLHELIIECVRFS